MIRIDALWLAAQPMDMRAGPERLLADVFALLADVDQHLLGRSGQCIGAQTAQVLGFEVTHIEHVHSVPRLL